VIGSVFAIVIAIVKELGDVLVEGASSLYNMLEALCH
jgi:hypothetical protein